MFWKVQGGREGLDPLLTDGHFNYTNRPARDTFWGFIFVIVLVATFAGGFYGISKRYALLMAWPSVIFI